MTKKSKKIFSITGLVLVWSFAIISLVAMIWRNYQTNNFVKIFGNNWYLFSLGFFVTFGLGWKYLYLAHNEIFRWHKFGMNIIVVMSTQLSLWYTLYLNISGGMSDIVEASIFTILFLETGDAVKAKLESKASSELASIVSLQPKTISVWENEKIISRKLNDVLKDEIIFIDANEIISLDGILISETALLNTQIVNGENDLTSFKRGDSVFSGMINNGESILIKVTNTKKDSLLNRMIKQINEIQFKKTKLQNNIDKIVQWFAPALFLISIFGFLISYFVLNRNDINDSVRILITILVAACPCALGIAVPLAVAVASAKSAGHGIVFNKTDVFYRLKKIKYIAFDKTGTLTSGRAVVTKAIYDKKYLPIIGLIEKTSGHTLSRATVNWILDQNIKIPDLKIEKLNKAKFEINNDIYEILTRKVIDESYQLDENISLDDKLKTTTYFAINKKVIAQFSYEDTLRKGAKEIVAKMIDQNIKPIIISGDNESATSAVAKNVGISEFYFDQTGEDKAKIIKNIQQKHQGVAFVGDGINDTLAINQSDLSIAIVSPTSYVKLESDLTLVDPNLFLLTSVFDNLKVVKINIFLNLMWALAYNIIVIPLAFFSMIDPIIGMAAMFLSSILIVLNTILFKYKKWKTSI